MLLETSELLGRLAGHPNQIATEVRKLGVQYKAVIDGLLAGQGSASFLIEEKPTHEEFQTGWVWFYYQDLRPPIAVNCSRQRGGTALELRSNPNGYLLVVRFEQKGNKPSLLHQINLPYMYSSFCYPGDCWERRRDHFLFGIDLANFAANHKPEALPISSTPPIM